MVQPNGSKLDSLTIVEPAKKQSNDGNIFIPECNHYN